MKLKKSDKVINLLLEKGCKEIKSKSISLTRFLKI